MKAPPGAIVPILRIPVRTLLPMKVGVHGHSLRRIQVVDQRMGAVPVALCIPPERLKRQAQVRGRCGCDQRGAEFIGSHGDSSLSAQVPVDAVSEQKYPTFAHAGEERRLPGPKGLTLPDRVPRRLKTSLHFVEARCRPDPVNFFITEEHRPQTRLVCVGRREPAAQKAPCRRQPLEEAG